MAGGEDIGKIIYYCLKYLVIKSRMFQYQKIPINWSLQCFCAVANCIVLFKFARRSDPEIVDWLEIHGSLIIILTMYTIYMNHTLSVCHLNRSAIEEHSFSTMVTTLLIHTLNTEVCIYRSYHGRTQYMHGNAWYRENIWTAAVAGSYTPEILLWFCILSALYWHVL